MTREISIFSLLTCLSLGITFFVEICMAQNTTVPVNVGVVLNMDTWVGNMELSCISMALSDFYASHSDYKTRLILHTRDSKSDVVGAAAAALDLIKNVEAQAIIGPDTSPQTKFVVDLGDKAQLPIVTFGATSPSLSPSLHRYLFQATQNDSSQVKAISSLMQVFGWRDAVPIYVDNEYGYGVIPYLTDALEKVDVRVPYRSVISPSATDVQIGAELYKLMTMQTRVFIVHMLPSLGLRIFSKAKEIGMMNEGYVWIMTNGMTNELSEIDSSDYEPMQGVLGVKTYVPRTKTLSNFRIRWKRKFQQENPTILNANLNIFGLWAYDAATALAFAIEQVGTDNFKFQSKNVSGNITDLDNFGISQTGPKLRQALLSTRFSGLSGNYSLIEGQLQSSTFQIVNIFGKGERGIGYWTLQNGITRDLEFTKHSVYNTSMGNLKPIIWPGESTKVPRGWEIPTSGKKLRIGVPIKKGFDEFVEVIKDSVTKTSIVKGYCIDVFKAVIEALPYSVLYEFIPFEKPDGEMGGSYDELVYQVYNQSFDAVVGDITIIANRSLYVDFTLPYTESGVSMIVPIKDSKSKSAWIFLKPLTWELWVTTDCFFIFIGFVVWVLEHRINEDFRGPPLYQIGVIFWFSFSTMVFANRERIMSNLARFVVIIWIFVVLILTSSYTASLASMLTVQQMQPTIRDINELLKKGENVGYQKGSFVLALLKQLNFDESKLKAYTSPEGDEVFSKGTANGGIAAAFDEIPYMKLLLSRYCSKYAMVQPTYKTDGFGFVFPRGSPLVPDISRAILHVTESEKMVEIEKAWFDQKTCQNSSIPVSSSSLSIDSFSGLFLIAGGASFLALIIFLVKFLYEHRHILTSSDTGNSIRNRIALLARRFDRKDLSSHTFKKSEPREGNGIELVEASPCTNFAQSPSSFSCHTEGNFISYEEHVTSPTDYCDPNSTCQTPDRMGTSTKYTNNPTQESPEAK